MHITTALREFPARYKIVPPLLGLVAGILLDEYIGHPWLLITITAPLFGVTALLRPPLRSLLFVPIGLLFAANPFNSGGVNVTSYEGIKTDLEGTLYRPPEKKESGSRLFLDTEYAVSDGKFTRVQGKVMVSTAGDIQGLSYGDRIRVIGIKLRAITDFRNPGAFDVKKYYERQGIYATGFVEGNKRIISFGRDRSYSPVLYSLDRLRQMYGNFVRSNFPSPESEILNALTIGDDGGIPPGVRAGFSKAGVAHVLSISGLHVGAVAVVFFFLIKWLLKRSEYLMLRFKVMRIAAALTIPLLFLYTAVAGFNTPAVRAFIMISVFLLAIMAGRNENKLNTLGVAAFATLPLLVESFGIIPLVSVPANTILVPLVELIIVPLGLLSFLAFTISEHIAGPLIYVNIHFIRMMVFGIGLFLEIPYSSLSIPPLNPLSLLLFLALGVSVLLAARTRRFKYVIPAIALAFAVSAAYPVIRASGARGLTASFLDTGGARTVVFFELPGGGNVLIDGGYSSLDRDGYIERNVVARFLLHSGVNRIDTLILTSADKDHLSGAGYLLRNFDVGMVFTNGDKLGGELWGIIREENLAWKDLNETDTVSLGGGAAFEVLKPGVDFVISDSSRPRPLAIRIAFNEVSILTGEGLDGGRTLSSLSEVNGDKLMSSVLYLRSIEADDAFVTFLRAVSPRILITGGPVPSPCNDDPVPGEALAGITVFNTSVDGEVSLETDGSGMTIETYVGEKKVVLK